MTRTTMIDHLRTRLIPMLGELEFTDADGNLPETIWDLLRVLRDEARAMISDVDAPNRSRLEITIREIELVLAEERDPAWDDRPLWPRAVRIIARMIEDEKPAEAAHRNPHSPMGLWRRHHGHGSP